MILSRKKKDQGGLAALLPKPAAAAPLSVFPPGLATQTERASDLHRGERGLHGGKKEEGRRSTQMSIFALGGSFLLPSAAPWLTAPPDERRAPPPFCTREADGL